MSNQTKVDIFLAVKRVEELCKQITTELVEETECDSYLDMAEKYYYIYQLHKQLKVAIEMVSSTKTSLLTTLSTAMATKGVESVSGPEDSAIYSEPVIYHKIDNADEFREWVERAAEKIPSIRHELLELKPRAGTAKEPGLKQLVKTEVKLARQELREPRLPDGISYSEPPKLVIRKRKPGSAIENEAKSIIDRLLEL